MLVSLSIATVWLKTVVIYVSRWRNFCIYMWMNIVVKKCSRIFPQLAHTCITIFGLKYLLLRGLDDKILTDNFLTDFGVFPNGDPTFLSNFTSDHTDAKITAVQSHAIKHVHRFQYPRNLQLPTLPTLHNWKIAHHDEDWWRARPSDTEGRMNYWRELFRSTFANSTTELYI